ncbi:MAG: hypothetical protein JNK12_11675 [Acidimicrobiales bacterium]|nr:hypothetical protein [Acidimicrobiales bacterium]
MVTLTAVLALLQPKEWETTATVTLDPFPIAGLHAGTVGASREDAMAGEVAAARSERFHDGLAQDSTHDITFTVEGDASTASMRFTATSDSAKRSFEAAASVANGYVAWGRRQQAAERAAALQGEIDELRAEPDGTYDPEVLDHLSADLAATQAVLNRLPGAGGTLTDLPPPPEQPVRPDLMLRLLLAAAVGLIVGLVVSLMLDRRQLWTDAVIPEWGGVGGTRERRGRVALAVLGVLLPLVLAAPALVAVVSVWELRPVTADTEVTDYACLESWVDAVPDGSAVAVSEDSPAFFRDHLHEYVLPRLTVPGEGRPAPFVLRVAPGDGPQACGGYHIEAPNP